MNKKILFVIMITVISLAFISCKKEEETKDNDLFSGARYVRTAQAFIGDIENILNYSGYVKYDKVIVVTPKISGKIEKIFVKEGDFVKQNQLLAKIDKNSLEQFEANFNFADKNYKRAQILFNEQAIDLKTFEEIETQWINAKTSFDFAKENLEVRAPFSGIVSNVSMKELEFYEPIMMGATGEAGLFRIISEGDVSIDVFVSDNDVRLLKKDQKARIRANQTIIDGRIGFISPENDRLTGMSRVKVDFKNSESELRNNQFVLVELIPEYKENVVMIPKNALIDEDTVIMVKDNRSHYRKIQTGMVSRHFVEVVSGLKDGEIVIIEGNSGLDDNYPVTEFSN